MLKFCFPQKLTDGIIKSRKGQFVIFTELNGEVCRCHCPTTGRIGNIDIGGRPCLLSKTKNTSRKTQYTVEAISLNNPEDKNKKWIGINQNAINRYVEYYLINNSFKDMIDTSSHEVLREQTIGMSKLDFLVGNTYIEVKMPLQHLQVDIPSYVKTRKSTPFNSTERFIKHVSELGKSLGENRRAILLTCFIYDNPGFKVVERSKNYDKINTIVKQNVSKGVELWQANFEITAEYIVLKGYSRFCV